MRNASPASPMDLLALHAELANTTSSFGPNGHHAPEELGVAGPPPPLVSKIPPMNPDGIEKNPADDLSNKGVTWQPRTDPQLAHLLPLELKEYYGLFPSEAPKKFDMSATGPDPLKDPLAPGDLVIVWGLQGEEAEYNDRAAHSAGEQRDDGTWAVTFQGGPDPVYFKRENLVRLASTNLEDDVSEVHVRGIPLRLLKDVRFCRGWCGKMKIPTTSPFHGNVSGVSDVDLKICSKCGVENFCGKDCITKAWPEHKRVCSLWKVWRQRKEVFKDLSLQQAMTYVKPHCFYARAFLIVRPERLQPTQRLLATRALNMLMTILSVAPYYFTWPGIVVEAETLALFFSVLPDKVLEQLDVLLRPVAACLNTVPGYTYADLRDDLAQPRVWEKCNALNYFDAAIEECTPCFYKNGCRTSVSTTDLAEDDEGEGGQTPLIKACGFNSTKSVCHLLLHGAACQIDRPSNDGCRPLHYAVSSRSIAGRCGKYEPRQGAGAAATILAILVHFGADVNSKTNGGVSSLHMAFLGGNPSAMRALLRLGATAHKHLLDVAPQCRCNDLDLDQIGKEDFIEARYLFQAAATQGNKRRKTCDHPECEKRQEGFTKFNRCCRCAQAFFCSKDCQLAAHKSHKQLCIPVIAPAVPKGGAPNKRLGQKLMLSHHCSGC